MRAFTATRCRTGARVGALYTIDKTTLSEEYLHEERERLTLQPKASFGAPPPPFSVFVEDATTFSVPRFYGLDRFGDAEFDERVEGKNVSLTFTGTLNEVQERAMTAVHARHMRDGGVWGTTVSLPCGFGKTVFGVAMAVRHGKCAFVLVHKATIRDQWKESFERFCPGVRVGFIQGKTWEVDGYDVVIGMVMTIAKRDLEATLFDDFGLLICDEAHHLAAPVMSRAMRCFRAKRILGLTATRERPDGLTPLLDYSLGPLGFHMERDSSEKIKVSIALFQGGTREILTKAGRPLVAVMLNNLAVHAARNAFIARRVVAFRKIGRVIMVLSDRIAQLLILRDMVVAQGIPTDEVGIFKGGQSKRERDEQLARPIVMCTYGIASEGIDKREADTCVMATPKGRVTQCIGRIQRPCAQKQEPLVVDIVDDVPIFASLRWSRQRWYSKQKYATQVLNADVDESEWFA